MSAGEEEKKIPDALIALYSASDTECDIIAAASRNPYVLHMASYVMPEDKPDHGLGVQQMHDEVHDYIMTKYPLNSGQAELAIWGAVAIKGAEDLRRGQA